MRKNLRHKDQKYDHPFIARYTHEATLRCWCDHLGNIVVEQKDHRAEVSIRLFPEGANMFLSVLQTAVEQQKAIYAARRDSEILEVTESDYD